jgi:hypothetical protein
VEQAGQADGESEAGEPGECAKTQFGPPDLVPFRLESRLEKQEDEAEFGEEFDRIVVCDQSHHAGADQDAKNEFEPDDGHQGEGGETNQQRRENRHAGNRENTAKFVHQALLGSIVCFSMLKDSVTAKTAKFNRRP